MMNERIDGIISGLGPLRNAKNDYEIVLFLANQLQCVCNELGLGDTSSYGRLREAIMSIKFGHKLSDTFSGADAYEPDGTPVEYKATTGKSIKATYNGISVYPSIEEQIEYLKNKKIGPYLNHYFARFNDKNEIVEAYRMNSTMVLSLIIPKIERKFHKQGTKKDPRLGAGLTKSEIYKFGEKII